MSEYQSALSASRAKDYKQCPLKFRYLVVDRIRQPQTTATLKGTLIHSVLEHLYELPAASRTTEVARDLIAPKWDELNSKDPTYLPIIEADQGVDRLLSDARDLVDGYFALERPQWIEPSACESLVEVQLTSGLFLRGFVDRIDRAADGRLRVIDYKTGKAPSPRFMQDALFQMRFYALMLRDTDVLPARMQLLYLKHQKVLTLDPEEVDIERFEDELMDLWKRIEDDARAGEFTPRKGPLCGWCDFQSRCPLFGGAIPEPASEDLDRLLSMRQ